MKKPVIFTDLDGTLLDHETYSFEAATPAIRLIEEMGIPLVVCSSKTRREIERWRTMLGNRHPFIAENGGALFIPAGYFASLPPDMTIDRNGEFDTIRLGAPYRELRAALCALRDEGFAVRGFGDMTPQEVAEATALPPGLAALAKEREHDEPFLFAGDAAEEERLLEAIRNKGFHATRGVFLHLLGASDKGKAVALLDRLYRENYGEIVTIALGDSPNDLPMLEWVDFPVLVQQPDGRHDPRITLPGLIRADGIGPAGWNRAILDLLSRLT